MNEIDYEYETVVKAIAFIESRCKNQTNVSVEEVSNYVGYSSKQLNRMFIKVKGISIAEYISFTKINHAGNLIAMGLDVEIAADRSNLSQSSLLKGMKGKIGLRPSDLKKNNSIKLNMGKTIAVGFSTGGVGASTLSLIIGAFLAQNNKVLVIDASPIASTSFVLMGKNINKHGLSELMGLQLDRKMFYKRVKFGLLGAMVDQEPQKYIVNLSANFHVLPNDGYLAYYLPQLLYLEKRIEKNSFKHIIEKLKCDYNYIIIDTHYSGLDEISDFAVRASDHILIPLHARARLAFKIARTLELIDEKGLDKTHVTGVFRRDYDLGKFGLAIEKDVKKQYGQIIFKGFLPDHESVREAVYGYDTLVDSVNQRRVPFGYYALIIEVCNRLAQS